MLAGPHILEWLHSSLLFLWNMGMSVACTAFPLLLEIVLGILGLF